MLRSSQNIEGACKKLLKYLHSIRNNTEDENNFLSSFDKLLFQIFGFGEVSKKCWILSSCEDYDTYKMFLKLMDPYGPFFKLILKYSDPFYNYVLRFHFPKSKLPYGTVYKYYNTESSDAQSFTPYYFSKLKNVNEDNIFLDIFEYFFFLFSSFVIYNRYDFECNFSGFKQYNKTLLSPIKWFNKKMGKTSQDDEEDEYNDPFRVLLQKYLNFFFKKGKKTYLPFGNNVFKELSEKFLQILVDFWLNQSVKTVDGFKYSYYLVSNITQIVQSILVLVKNMICDEALKNRSVNFFQNIQNLSGSTGSLSGIGGGRGYVSPLTPYFEFLKLPLFNFIYSLYSQFPTTKVMPFNLLTDLWLCYIQPWKQFKSEKDFENFTPYILSNWIFYSTNFISFLKYVASFFTEATTDQIEKVHEVLTFFSDDKLLLLVRIIDNFLEEQKVKTILMKKYNNTQLKYLLESGVLTDHIVATFGSLVQYESIFSKKNYNVAAELFVKCHTYSMYISEKEHSTWFTPKKKMSIDRTIKSINNMLCKIFNIKFGDKKKGEVKMNLEKQNWVRERSRNRNRRGEPVTPKRNFYTMRPDTKGRFISPKGIRQIQMGIAKCSKLDTEYIGDDMYAPVTSNEVSFMIPPTVFLSEKLNELFKNGRGPVISNKYLRIERFNLRFLATKMNVFWMVAFFLLFLFFYVYVFQG